MNRPSPDDMKAMGVVDYVTELEMENKKLKAENKELKNELEKFKTDIIYEEGLYE